MGNAIKTTLLLGALTGIFLLIGEYFGGQVGLVIAFFFAVILNFGSYWFSDKIVLAMYKGKQVSEADAPQLHSIIRRLTQRAGLPMPRVYIIPTDAPNAFATGRNPDHAAVAVTQGILRLLNETELEGVLAHELGHVKNRDILISSIAATIAGAIMMIARIAQFGAFFGGFGSSDDDEGGGILGLLAMIILAPIAAMVIQMAISRSREYQADATGTQIAGDPEGLASALEKLHSASQRVPLPANPATSHLFIVKPFTAKTLMNLFSTHPPMEERVARLRSMRAY